MQTNFRKIVYTFQGWREEVANEETLFPEERCEAVEGTVSHTLLGGQLKHCVKKKRVQAKYLTPLKS